MKVSSMKLLLLPPPLLLLLLLLLLSLRCQPSNSATILVDGVSEWKSPTVYIGDCIIFRHKYGYNLYIFQNQRAFDLCNFTQATLLTKSDSISYTWYPSRQGFFYFTFHNGSLSSCNQHSKKLSIKVSPPSLPLPPLSSPAPASGGVVPSSPSFPWPFHPREAAHSSFSSSSSPAPGPMPLFPDKGGGGNGGNGNMPFINSNPAVPLPTGEVDSATIRPLPTATSGFSPQVKVGLLGRQMTLLCVVLLLFMYWK